MGKRRKRNPAGVFSMPSFWTVNILVDVRPTLLLFLSSDTFIRVCVCVYLSLIKGFDFPISDRHCGGLPLESRMSQLNVAEVFVLCYPNPLVSFLLILLP